MADRHGRHNFPGKLRSRRPSGSRWPPAGRGRSRRGSAQDSVARNGSGSPDRVKVRQSQWDRGSAVDLTRPAGDTFSAQLPARFDIVRFDPRGSGSAGPRSASAMTNNSRPCRYDRRQTIALDQALGQFLDWRQATPARCSFGAGDRRQDRRSVTLPSTSSETCTRSPSRSRSGGAQRHINKFDFHDR